MHAWNLEQYPLRGGSQRLLKFWAEKYEDMCDTYHWRVNSDLNSDMSLTAFYQAILNLCLTRSVTKSRSDWSLCSAWGMMANPSTRKLLLTRNSHGCRGKPSLICFLSCSRRSKWWEAKKRLWSTGRIGRKGRQNTSTLIKWLDRPRWWGWDG